MIDDVVGLRLMVSVRVVLCPQALTALTLSTPLTNDELNETVTSVEP